ncbi:MAG: hypothetical protein OEW89_08575 [Gammaproteobacteria bacterium]|nr:hypothetical protein [Gammaproteobacteria bacterium]MDH5592859.1 hypothetical protein [Gammaproteobacteria bacterium]MDH5614622.1 hypothetical protein [Gammaproteobacteria bacterium]
MYKFDIFPEKELIIMIFSGSIDFQEIMEANAMLVNDPGFKQWFNGVVDHRKTEFQLSIEEIKEIAKGISDNNVAVGKWVMMVESPESTALSSVYVENVKQQHPQNICSTIKGASEYLGIDLSGYLEPGLYD